MKLTLFRLVVGVALFLILRRNQGRQAPLPSVSRRVYLDPCEVHLVVRRSEWEGRLTVPKSGRERKVVLTERLKDALTKNRHLRGDRVLWRDDGLKQTKVIQVLLAKWMGRAQRRAGLKVTGGIHILRHTFCSRLAMAGASTKAIQELAGHEQVSTTQRYMHLSPAAKAFAIAPLDQGADLKAEGSQAAGAEVGCGAGTEQNGSEGGA